jgi:hypothetical protein
MSQDATAIRMRTQNFIDRQNRLIDSANHQATADLEANHARMRDTMRAYGEALDQQLQTVLTSTITEDTLNQEMEIAAQAHRDRIHGITAIPPLLMDEDRLQLQTRSATLEQQAEDLRDQLHACKEQNDSLHKKMKKMQEELQEQEDTEDTVEALTQESSKPRGDNEELRRRLADCGRRAAKVDLDFNRMKRAMQLDEKEAQVDRKVTLGLKARMDTAENELERLKRKRKDSISPDRVITGILKRPNASPLSSQQAARADDPPTSAQPTPKKSRSRKEKWSNSACVPLTSFNQDGVQEKKEQTSLARKRDPVLNNPPSSVGRKNDIIKEIEESAKTLSLSREDTSFVFHRSNADDQVVVTKKAQAYVESIITATCVHKLKGAKATGNPVQAYLDTLSLSLSVSRSTKGS